VLSGGEIAEGVSDGTEAGLVLEGMLIACGIMEPEDWAAKLLELANLPVLAEVGFRRQTSLVGCSSTFFTRSLI
jgi:hypothetical protein